VITITEAVDTSVVGALGRWDTKLSRVIRLDVDHTTEGRITMDGLRKALAVFFGVILLGLLVMGGLRLFNLAGGDVAWLRAIPWFVFLLGLVLCGALIYVLVPKRREP
jgi:hypothetical protein